MRALFNRLKHFGINQEAATATEYAIVLTLIVVVAWLAVYALGTDIRNICQLVSDGMAAPDPA